jgi:hypothetical protein
MRHYESFPLLFQRLIQSQLHTTLESPMRKRKDLVLLTDSYRDLSSELWLSVCDLSSHTGRWNIAIRNLAMQTTDISMTLDGMTLSDGENEKLRNISTVDLTAELKVADHLISPTEETLSMIEERVNP